MTEQKNLQGLQTAQRDTTNFAATRARKINYYLFWATMREKNVQTKALLSQKLLLSSSVEFQIDINVFCLPPLFLKVLNKFRPSDKFQKHLLTKHSIGYS